MFKKREESVFFKSRQLHRKLSGANKTLTVGVAGIKGGIGVTGLVLMIVSYLEKHRGKVAAVEMGEKQGFRSLHEAIYGEEPDYETDYFKVRRTYYYSNYHSQTVVELKQLNFELIVIDFGEITNKNTKIFNEQDIQLLVGCGEEWNFTETLDVLFRFNERLTSQWKLIIYEVTPEVKRLIEKRTNRQVFSVSKNRPFSLDKESSIQIESLLGII